MRLKQLLTAAFLLALGTLAQAQDRYLDQVFTQASATTRIYGYNYTVLPLVQPGAHTARQPLVVQIYQPVGDVATNRPLIIYLHTGNFFPFPQNGSCGGTLTDSSNVEFATRLAKMGYVVAVADYRLGWNPFSSEELTRRFTLINAAYRGVQDVRSCIRYFRKNVAENGNEFGIDPDKIVVWGQGTGGYLSLATAYLNEFNDIYTTSDPNKFKVPNPQAPGTFLPMVWEQYNGDITGEGPIRTVDAQYSAITMGQFQVGDTLFAPNNVGYSSEFQLAVNAGGALGDSTWLDDGEIPLISFHVPSDPFAPCGTDILNVPTLSGPQPVVEVSGSCTMQVYAENYGNNAIFNTIPAGADPYGDIAKSINGGLSGFYPFYGTPNNTSAPWEWTTVPPAPPTANCNTDASLARPYIDTMIGYFAPRACVALGLGCNLVNTNSLVNASFLKLQPNPATAEMQFLTDADHQMLRIELYNAAGRLVRSTAALNATNYTLHRNGLSTGFYLAKVYFANGVTARKVIFE